MKAILISTRPQWVEKILNGIKKDEIRKGTALYKAINKLIKKQGVAPMLLYCTKDKKIFLRDFRDKKKWAAYWRFVAMGNDPSNVGELPPILNGKVVARFNATAEKIEYDTCSRDISGWWKDDGKMYDHSDACLTYKEMFDYIGAGDGTVIHINDLVAFNKPKEISEFQGTCNKSCEANRLNVCKIKPNCNRPLTRAPQSFCFIEIE